jgi:cell division protein FtsI (penicillin-binding protein 3)
MLTVINGIINDGILINPTLICRKCGERRKVVLRQTSVAVRALMRDAALNGTARNANKHAKGYRIFGKTGTTHKNKNGHYATDAHNKQRVVSFVAGFPFEDPQYILLVMLDNPQATSHTFGQATAGWNAAPCGGKIIERIASLLGVAFSSDDEG